MAACPEYEPLLIEKAGGFLSPESASKLARHLDGCAKCRAEESLFTDVLELAQVQDEPGRIDGSLAGATLGCWNRYDRRRTRTRSFAAGAVLVAGLATAFWIHHAGNEHRAARALATPTAAGLISTDPAEPASLPALSAELRALEADPEVEPLDAWASPEAIEPIDSDELETLFNPADVENNG